MSTQSIDEHKAQETKESWQMTMWLAVYMIGFTAGFVLTWVIHP